MATLLLFTGEIVRDNDLSFDTLNPNLVSSPSQFPQEPLAPALSHFYETETTITRNFSTAGRYKCDIEYVQNPTSGSSARYRVEDQKRTPIIRQSQDQMFSFSFYVPTTTNILPTTTMTFYQWHAGESQPFGSPSWRFDIRKVDGFDVMSITMRWGNSPSSSNLMRFTLGRLVKNQWYDFVVRHIWDYDILVGKSVVWMNGEVAKAYDLNGGSQILIPTTGTSQDESGSSKGSFQTVEGVSVFDWIGRTVYPPDQYNKNNKYAKWGLMDSGITIGNGYYSSTTPYELTNTTDPLGSNYIDLDLYGYGKADFIFDNVNWDTNAETVLWQRYENVSYNRSQPTTFPSGWIPKPVEPPTPTNSWKFKVRKPLIV